MLASAAAASMSAARGWPGSSPSGRLLTSTVTPCSASPATSCGAIWPLTKVRSSSWRIIILASSFALLRRGDGLDRSCRGRRRRARGRRGCSAFVATPEAEIDQIWVDARVVPGKRPVHFRIIERVAARKHHVAEALAVGAGEAAIRLEPGECVLPEHPRPRVSIITGRIAVAPDVEEIARAVARRDVGGVVTALGERVRLEPVDILQRRRRRKRMPVDVEARRFEHL